VIESTVSPLDGDIATGAMIMHQVYVPQEQARIFFNINFAVL
jgi:hypothetical protein